MASPERDIKSGFDAKSDSGTTSFSASTSTPVGIDTRAREIAIGGGAGYSNPPPYRTAGPSAPSAGAASPRVNHLYFNRERDSIKESFTVDVDLVVPPQLLPTADEGRALDNLNLVSTCGSVTADVALVGQGKKRASLVAESKHGSVKFKFVSRVGCSFRLTAQSDHGAVRIYLPRDFVGPITSSTDHGGLDLSEAVKQYYMPFSDDHGTAKGFIGDWTGSGYGDAIQSGAEWTGDELITASKYGRVKVFYSDEATAAGGGFWSSWFKGFT